VHIRVQQRNGKKSLTTVQGLKKAYDYKKVLKALKKGEWWRAGFFFFFFFGGAFARARAALRFPPHLPFHRLRPPCQQQQHVSNSPLVPESTITPHNPYKKTRKTTTCEKLDDAKKTQKKKPTQKNDNQSEFCCNGTVVDDPELGQVIQLQGDQRKNVVDFLTAEKLVKKDLIKVHGF